MRIHLEYKNFNNLTQLFLLGSNSPLSRSIETLQSILMVRPVEGNLTIPPQCEEYTDGLNTGKCISPLPSQDNYTCGEYGNIPLDFIGAREVCSSVNGSCRLEGPNGGGVPNADYLLFFTVFSSSKIQYAYKLRY